MFNDRIRTIAGWLVIASFVCGIGTFVAYGHTSWSDNIIKRAGEISGVVFATCIGISTAGFSKRPPIIIPFFVTVVILVFGFATGAVASMVTNFNEMFTFGLMGLICSAFFVPRFLKEIHFPDA